MKRKILVALLLSLIPLWVQALGLGELKLNSGLNQPFDARIRLLSPTANDLSSLKVELADADAFRRAGIDRPFILSLLKFKVEDNESGPAYIRITSSEAIREPFLNFLLEASWSNGRLFREYTVLLDPPLYDPNARKITKTPATAPAVKPEVEGVQEQEQEQQQEQEEAAQPSVSVPAVVAGTYKEDKYGPTVSGDTLWSIASRARPDSSVSVQQMMLAILRANPDAFLNNNVNGLKRGYILHIPEPDEINTLTKSEALSQVKSQYAAWDEFRGTVAAATPERPVSTTGETKETAAAQPPLEEEGSELRLVAPSKEGAGDEQAAGGQEADEKVKNDLALANEQLAALTAENSELNDRLTESETIIKDLKRLIELKDDELAKLQEQLAKAPSGEEAAAVEEGAGEPKAVEEKAAGGIEEAAKPETATAPGETKAGQEKPKPTVQPPAVSPVAGIVNQVRSFVMGNLLLVGGALGGLVLLIVILVALRKWRSSAAEEVVLPVTAEDYPDLAGEAETEMPPGSEDVTDIKVPVEPEAEAEETEEADEEATVFMDTSEVAHPPEEVAVEETPLTEEPEDDPLAEVNVFLAYEHFDQAEEFVRDAIAKEPDNLEFRSKLLEVFYAAGDKAKYEEAAEALHDKVNGQGPHWEMALAMWQELSPHRALFEAPLAGEEDEKADTTGGGIVDLTAEESGGEDSGSIDFDLGSDTVAETPGSDEEEDMLDITAGAVEAPSSLDLTAATSSSEETEEILDLTAAASVDEMSDAYESSEQDDVLDVTAAVGLDADEFESTAVEDSGDGDLLNITGGEEVSDDSVLDITGSGISGDDLLDVTSHHGNFKDEEIEEDLLDVTSATRASANSSELLEVGSTEEETETVEDEGDSTLDFDIGEMEASVPPSEEKTIDVSLNELDNVIEFDAAAGTADTESDDDGIELDLSSDDEGDAGLSIGDEDTGLSLEVGEQEEDAGGNEIEFDLSLEEETPAETEEVNIDGGGIELSLEEGDSEKQNDGDGVPEIDMDSTVEIPKSSLKLAIADEDEDEDEGDGDSTVFVPRSSATQEQSIDDEIATKLDLAKAYVELGDKDSAKSILDEVMSAGNEEQKKIAQDLMVQMT